MWDCIKKIKDILSDPYEQIMDNMIERTLAEEIVPFDEWEDLLDLLDEEDIPDSEAILREHGLTMPELVERAEASRREFLSELRRFDLPANDRFALSRKLCELAKTSPSDELLRLYCNIVSDGGFLLDQERAGEEGSICWLYGKADSDALYGYLSKRAAMAVQFKETLAKAKKINLPPTGCMLNESTKQDAVFQAYVQTFELSGNHTCFLDNIAWVLHIADSSPALAAVKPLFLYRMLTRHRKRLQTSETLRIDFRALWNYQEYRINTNNGKNYKMNVRHLTLFSRLCSIYESDSQVDLPLCIYGFQHLSNLGDFYSMYMPEGAEISFDASLEDILLESLFSCFENGYEDNVAAMDYNISERALERFQGEACRNQALEKISDYMNRNLEDLLPRFLNASPKTVKALCGEVLNAASLSAAQQPQNVKETSLFLAAINSGFMEAVEYYAADYLVQAGKALTGETAPY